MANFDRSLDYDIAKWGWEERDTFTLEIYGVGGWMEQEQFESRWDAIDEAGVWAKNGTAARVKDSCGHKLWSYIP